MSSIRNRPDWDEYFTEIASTVSLRADCRRRQVGCVLVREHRIISTGYNGAPSGAPGCLEGHCPRGLRSYSEVREFSDYAHPESQCISVHAETNALLYAGLGETRGSTAYITCEPCFDCRKNLRAAGVVRAVYLKDGDLHSEDLSCGDVSILPRMNATSV